MLKRLRSGICDKIFSRQYNNAHPQTALSGKLEWAKQSKKEIHIHKFTETA